MTPTRDELERALSAASAAHHDYETHFLEGERDERWTGWYAAYVLGRLGDFTTPTTLTRLLKAAPTGDPWASAAADYVVEKLGG